MADRASLSSAECSSIKIGDTDKIACKSLEDVYKTMSLRTVEMMKKIYPEMTKYGHVLCDHEKNTITKMPGDDEMEELTILLKKNHISFDSGDLVLKTQLAKDMVKEMNDKLGILNIVQYTGSQHWYVSDPVGAAIEGSATVGAVEIAGAVAGPLGKVPEHNTDRINVMINSSICDKKDNYSKLEANWKELKFDEMIFNSGFREEIRRIVGKGNFKNSKLKLESFKEFYDVSVLTRKFIQNEMKVDLECEKPQIEKKSMIRGHIFICARIFYPNIDILLFEHVATFAENLRRQFREKDININVTTITPVKVVLQYDPFKSEDVFNLIESEEKHKVYPRQEVLKAMNYVLNQDNGIHHIFLRWTRKKVQMPLFSIVREIYIETEEDSEEFGETEEDNDEFGETEDIH